MSSHRRIAVLIFALLGMAIAIYLGLFQAHVLDSVWDPVFGSQSVQVLRSPLSRSLPVPDSWIGAVGYLAEAILVSIGRPKRRSEHPWIVRLYALSALGMGTGSLGLVGYQAIGLHRWCGLCLASAAISIALMVPALLEARPAARKRRHGSPRDERYAA